MAHVYCCISLVLISDFVFFSCLPLLKLLVFALSEMSMFAVLGEDDDNDVDKPPSAAAGDKKKKGKKAAEGKGNTEKSQSSKGAARSPQRTPPLGPSAAPGAPAADSDEGWSTPVPAKPKSTSAVGCPLYLTT